MTTFCTSTLIDVNIKVISIKNAIQIMKPVPISIFPVNSKPFGCTFEEWSARWWQWLLSIPKSINPAFDSTGANANINQDNIEVFFLCQTYEEGGPPIPNGTVMYQLAVQYSCQSSIGFPYCILMEKLSRN